MKQLFFNFYSELEKVELKDDAPNYEEATEITPEEIIIQETSLLNERV